jgi:hypothetical protein
MTSIYKAIHEAIHSMKEYALISKKDLEAKDYSGLCEDAEELLEMLGEQDVNQEELEYNGQDMRHLIGSLKILRDQKGKLEKDVIKAAYHESRRHISGVMRELAEELLEIDSERE